VRENEISLRKCSGGTVQLPTLERTLIMTSQYIKPGRKFLEWFSIAF